ESIVIQNIGIAGIKGLGGGFDTKMLTYFGEPSMKRIVQETVDDTLKLENALQELTTTKKIVLMHYSPIRQTVIGESEEIFPFLGSSRYSDVIDRLSVSAVFHGHAHHGTHEGTTPQGTPVYNVAFPIMRELNLQQPYKIIEDLALA